MADVILSIGLPVHNEERHLRQALGCIFAQTFSDWELIVIDDGSTDRTLSILREIDDPRVRVVADGLNLGLAARMNRIAREARGAYVARLDGDDLMHPTRLEKQIHYLQHHPELDGVGCGLISFAERQRITGVRLFPATHQEICANPLDGIRIASATFVGRTAWFRRHPYNEANRCCEDWELWFRSHPHSNFGNIPELLYLYREMESYSLRKYARERSRIAALQWSRRRDFGLLRTSWACLMQKVRIGVHVAAAAAGLQQRLVQRRSQPADGHAQKLAAEAFAAAHTTTWRSLQAVSA